MPSFTKGTSTRNERLGYAMRSEKPPSTSGVCSSIGNRETAGRVDFKGYRLDDEEIPEFRYLLDGAEVRERIEARPGGGLVRSFHITSSEPVRLLTAGDVGVRFESSVGRFQNGVLTLTPQQAREFTVTMIPSAGGSQ